MKWIFYISISLMVVSALLRIQYRMPDHEVPVFLKQDKIAEAHETAIVFTSSSIFEPSSADSIKLLEDYSDIWAHLNTLFCTNDVKAGKEYYTESYFRQLCEQDINTTEACLSKSDTIHHLHLVNWAWDGLACSVMDTSVIFEIQLHNQEKYYQSADVAMVLNFEGDHWRVDALSIYNSKIYK